MPAKPQCYTFRLLTKRACSLGVLFWEICTREIPVRGRLRPLRIPDECSATVQALIEECLHFDPSKRPHAKEVALGFWLYEDFLAALQLCFWRRIRRSTWEVSRSFGCTCRYLIGSGKPTARVRRLCLLLLVMKNILRTYRRQTGLLERAVADSTPAPASPRKTLLDPHTAGCSVSHTYFSAPFSVTSSTSLFSSPITAVWMGKPRGMLDSQGTLVGCDRCDACTIIHIP